MIGRLTKILFHHGAATRYAHESVRELSSDTVVKLTPQGDIVFGRVQSWLGVKTTYVWPSGSPMLNGGEVENLCAWWNEMKGESQ